MQLAVLLLFWGWSSSWAQSNTLSSGGDAMGGGGSVSYSVGQMDYIQALGSGGSANQGVQQPYEIYVLGVDNHPEISLEFAMYPNPTTENTNLRIENFVPNELSYALYDIQGRLLRQEKIRLELTQIPMEALASSVYVLQIVKNTSAIKSFKIIKK